jgi:RNA-directed DNA polymerase
MTRCGGSLIPEGVDLLDLMLSRTNVLQAWKRVKANGGAAGIDKLSIAESAEMIRCTWPSIRRQIVGGSYRPDPVRRTEIPKGNGETRPLGIPTVLDRLIQQSLAQVLVQIFDSGFSPQSYGFRPKRSAHQAVSHIASHIKGGKRWAVDIDLSKFFDRVDHDLLMERVSRKVKDKRILKLIGLYLRAGVSVDGSVHPTKLGVPQGGPLSPLLANIMLDDLDKEMESRGHTFARYADDFVILVNSRKAGERVMNSLRRFIESKLKLIVNEEKSRVVPSGKSEFLGFTFARKKIRWTDKTLDKFKTRIRELTKRNWGVSIKKRLESLNRYLRGWIGYFRLTELYSNVESIDEWIRRRMRACVWKQWRSPRTKIRKLISMGVSKGLAIVTGCSSKKYWRLSKTFATNLAMSNQWFEDLGLISVKERWKAFHYPEG